MSAAPKLSFDNGGEFIRDTRREVEQYLADRRVNAAGRRALYAKGIVSFLLLAGCWAALMFASPGLALGPPLPPGRGRPAAGGQHPRRLVANHP